MKKYVIIVAGGRGARMDSDLPKQFISLSGKPIILHTISLFQICDPAVETIIAIHPGYREYWMRMLNEYMGDFRHILVDGGTERFHSVKNSLEHVPGGVLVAIHDAVRPLVSLETIRRSFDMAGLKGTAVPCIVIPESVRRIEPGGSKSVKREKLRIIQTPQVFHSDILKDAYQVDYRNKFTDDAAVVEHAGHSIHLVEGNIENIKITTREDIKLAEFYLQQRYR